MTMLCCPPPHIWLFFFRLFSPMLPSLHSLHPEAMTTMLCCHVLIFNCFIFIFYIRLDIQRQQWWYFAANLLTFDLFFLAMMLHHPSSLFYFIFIAGMMMMHHPPPHIWMLYFFLCWQAVFSREAQGISHNTGKYICCCLSFCLQLYFFPSGLWLMQHHPSLLFYFFPSQEWPMMMMLCHPPPHIWLLYFFLHWQAVFSGEAQDISHNTGKYILLLPFLLLAIVFFAPPASD